MSKTSSYLVVFNDIKIGLIYISINPINEDENVATIIPLDRSGTWTNGDSTVTLKDSFTDYYSADKSEADILKEITAFAAIEPWKVLFKPTP